jgi:pimeloyl-ACP methyl ester carboxylesterase
MATLHPASPERGQDMPWIVAYWVLFFAALLGAIGLVTYLTWGPVLNFLVLLGVIGLAAYLGVGAYAATTMSHPIRQKLRGTPADLGLPYENVAFPSAEDHIPLKGWLIGGHGGPTIIFVHGKDGNRDDPTIGLPLIGQALVHHGYDVLAFDLRGHGESGGSRFSLGYLEARDVAGAVAFLKRRGRTELGAFGWSLGAATVLNAAPDLPDLRALVVESAFAAVTDLMATQIPLTTHLPGLFTPGILLMSDLLYGFRPQQNRPERALARLGTRPLLLIQDGADEFIPPAHATRLQQAGAANPNFQFWQVPGATHVRGYQTCPDEYMRRVIAFFDANLPRRAADLRPPPADALVR